MIVYFGEVIKMCANISYLMMTLNRYLLVGKDHSDWLVSAAKLEFKWVIRGSFFVSVLINIGHGWQYLAVEDSPEAFAASSEYFQVNGDSYSEYPLANQNWAYFYFSVVYFVINFGAFFLINTVIEVKIVRRIHKELSEKRERLARLKCDETSLSTVTTAYSATKSTSKADESKNKIDKENEKKERKVIKMVVLNGIFNFVLRAPEIFFWIENASIFSLVFPDQSRPMDYLSDRSSGLGYYVPGLLGLVADIGYLSYILTFTTNFIIFYKFNKNFKEAVVFFKVKSYQLIIWRILNFGLQSKDPKLTLS
jgi:hypothetical protein